MGRTRRWIAVGVAVVALADLSAAGVYLTRPSGIVVQLGTGEHWQLFRNATNLTDNPVVGNIDGPIAEGTGPLADDHVRLPPGRYWLRQPQRNQANCFYDAGYRVKPHRWTSTPDSFAAPSCSIQ